MRRDRTRLARRALLALVVVVSGAVAWSLRRPSPTGPGPGAPQATAAPQGTTVGDMAFLRFREGEQKVEVKARAMVGREGDAMRLQGVEVTLPFVAEGRASRATITADECLYQPAPQRASFKGNVRVRTDDGFELDTDTLKYWGDEERVFTRDEARFRRGRTSGSATGMEYKAGSGLSLLANVKLRIEDESGAPAEVESATAHASREERLVNFDGGVLVREPGRELRSQRLQLKLTEDLGSVERAAAIEDVDLVAAPGAGLPGSATLEGGTKRLRCRRLNVAFRSKGVLLEAIAVNNASLEVEPGPRDPRERRRLQAAQIRFEFDEEGRLSLLQGRPVREGEDKGPPQAVLTAEPLGGGAAGVRTVKSNQLDAGFDPASGQLRWAQFEGAVTAVEPGRKAWAGKAVHDEGAGLVTLTGDPRIVDEGDGSELRGKTIELATRPRGVKASQSVRHTLGRRGRAGRGGMLGGEEPAVLTCRDFDYDPVARAARYRGNALLRSGRDEVRAPTIVLEEKAEGRRMVASGGTHSVLHPRAQKEAKAEPVPVEARSRDMVYEEAAGRIVYTGDVEIRQGDILTLSPEAIVVLTKDGGTVDRLLAGEPVEVQQGGRRATGQRGTYTPSTETFVLVGEKVVLVDVDRRIEGRVLTFQVGSDRIRVDGREEVRTEAVFKRKEPPKP
jgi:lipopolysaccharide transport protein LptA/LPS export ABC transporter protein LptC